MGRYPKAQIQDQGIIIAESLTTGSEGPSPGSDDAFDVEGEKKFQNSGRLGACVALPKSPVRARYPTLSTSRYR